MSAVPAFYNTNHLTGAELAQATSTALHQEEKVMAIFRLHPGQDLGPSKVWRFGVEFAQDDWILTSVRRAIFNLTDRGKLTKLDRTAMGYYGKPEHTWRITFTLGATP